MYKLTFLVPLIVLCSISHLEAQTTTTIIPVASTWKYWDLPSLPASDWHTGSYSDATWSNGAAELGYGDGDEVTPILYGGNTSNRNPTAYFRKNISLSTYNSSNTYAATLKIDDGAVVYVNGQEVYRNNLPTGAVGYTTLAVDAFINENAIANFNIPASYFTAGNNTIAVEMHQAVVTSSDLSFDLQLIQTTINNTNGAPTTNWLKAIGGSAMERANAVVAISSGCVVTGTTSSTNGDMQGSSNVGNCNTDIWVSEIDNNSNIIWKKFYGGSNYEEGVSIVKTTDNGYAILGTTYSNDGNVTNNRGNADIWLLKTNNTGDIQWQKNYGGSGIDKGSEIQTTSDGGFVVVGSTTSNDGDITGNHGNTDFCIVKLDANGNIQWKKVIGGSSWDIATSIQTTSDGGYIVGGHTGSVDGDLASTNNKGHDAWIVKLDANGAIQWNKIFGGDELDELYSVEQAADGYVFVGTSNSFNGDLNATPSNLDAWVVKTDFNGTIIWSQDIAGSGFERLIGLQILADGNMLISGYSSSNDNTISATQGNQDAWLLSMSSTGSTNWQQLVGGTLNEEFLAIQQGSNGAIYAVGYTTSNNGNITNYHGQEDALVTQLGQISFVGVASTINPSDFNLYPNPASEMVNMQFMNQIPMSIAILDISGRNIHTISKNTQEIVTLSTESLAAGYYLVRADFGNYTMCKPLVIKK